MKGISVWSALAHWQTGAASILGGVLLAMAGATPWGNEFRGGIKDDLELLALLPEDQSPAEACSASTNSWLPTTRHNLARRRGPGYQATGARSCVVLSFSIVWWDVNVRDPDVAAVVTGITRRAAC